MAIRAVKGHQHVLVNKTVRGPDDLGSADDSTVSDADTWSTELSMPHGFVMRGVDSDF
jgi:hypothetical protein